MIALENLSIIQQRYIETIGSICSEHNHAHTKDIAQNLNVKMPSVVDALKSLAKLNLIIYRSRRPVTLTKNGREIASKLNSRHQIFSDFFNKILGLNFEYSQKLACSVEHVVDETVKERLSALNQYISSNNECKVALEKFKDKYT